MSARRILPLAGGALPRKRSSQKSYLTLCFVFCIIAPLFWGGCCTQPARDAWQKMRSFAMQSSSSFLGRITSPRWHSYAHCKPNHPPTSKEHYFSPLPKAASLPLQGESSFRLGSSVRRLPCTTKFCPVHHILFLSRCLGILITSLSRRVNKHPLAMWKPCFLRSIFPNAPEDRGEAQKVVMQAFLGGTLRIA